MAKAYACGIHGKPCVNMHGTFEGYIYGSSNSVCRGGNKKKEGEGKRENGGKEKKREEEKKGGREVKERGKGRSVAQ